MNKYLLAFIALVTFGCTPQKSSLEGIWQANDRFSKATYYISAQRQGLKVQVLSYDDGTSSYTYKGGKKQYFAQYLRRQKQQYVDGMSGATQKQTGKTARKRLQVKNQDTLEVTTYVVNQPIKEYWVRR